MYLWKIEELKQRLKSNDLSEKEQFYYALAYILACSIGMEAYVWVPYENANIWDNTQAISNILIAFLGTIYAYKLNGASSGRDFLQRYFSIGFVVALKFAIIVFGILFAIDLSYALFPRIVETDSTLGN